MATRLTLMSVTQSAIFLLTCLLFVGGCHDPDPDPSPATQKSPAQGANPKGAGSAAASLRETESNLSSAEQNRRTEQRVIQLQQELTSARTQQTHLIQKREEISARIAAQQEQGMQLLTSLKAQHRAPSGSDQAFEGTARAQLETALAQDSELNHELEAAEKELSDVDARIATLTADLDAVSNIQSVTSDSQERPTR